MVAQLKQLPLTPTPEHQRNARRIAVLVNDDLAPQIIRSALLSLFVQAGEALKMPVAYSDGDELRVHPSDLAFLFLEIDRRGLEFSERGLMDAEGNYLQRRGDEN